MKERLNNLLKIIEDNYLDGLILFGRANIRYISNLRWNTASFSVLAIRPSGETFYGVPSLDISIAMEECWLSSMGEDGKFLEDNPNYLDI